MTDCFHPRCSVFFRNRPSALYPLLSCFTVRCFRRPGIINVIKIDMKFVRKFDERSKQIMRMLIARQLRDRYLCIPLNRQSEFIEAISGN